MNKNSSLCLSALLCLSLECFAQSPSLRNNTNLSRSARFRSSIAGGSANLIQTNSLASFIGGGRSNTVVSGTTNATVAGGLGNLASNSFVTVGGGAGNTASGLHSSVGGGALNSAGGTTAVVGGGSYNFATGYGSTVGGGASNEATGGYATVPGGISCRATNQGAFVWSGSDSVATVSTNDSSFTVRAPGGARFISTTDAALTNSNHGVILLPNATAWTALSDRESKTDYQPIKPRDILAKLAAMPVTSWKYKHDQSRRYIGPTAQDFMAAFQLGNDDKGINTMDADGIAFAAIQGLVEELKDRDARRERDLAERDATIRKFESELSTMRERISQLPAAP